MKDFSSHIVDLQLEFCMGGISVTSKAIPELWIFGKNPTLIFEQVVSVMKETGNWGEPQTELSL